MPDAPRRGVLTSAGNPSCWCCLTRSQKSSAATDRSCWLAERPASARPGWPSELAAIAASGNVSVLWGALLSGRDVACGVLAVGTNRRFVCRGAAASRRFVASSAPRLVACAGSSRTLPSCFAFPTDLARAALKPSASRSALLMPSSRRRRQWSSQRHSRREWPIRSPMQGRHDEAARLCGDAPRGTQLQARGHGCCRWSRSSM